MVEPDSMNNVTVYVKNEGNMASSISLATENWNPLNASDYLALIVSSSAHGIESFSFNIIISISS